jgi:hypothetical protein
MNQVLEQRRQHRNIVQAGAALAHALLEYFLHKIGHAALQQLRRR